MRRLRRENDELGKKKGSSGVWEKNLVCDDPAAKSEIEHHTSIFSSRKRRGVGVQKGPQSLYRTQG